MPTPRVTINELPEQATPEDANLIVIQDGATTKKMTLATLATQPSAQLAAHLADTVDAHDASAISATDSGNGIDGATVQSQLGQLATLADSVSDVVWVGAEEPTDPETEMWWDTEAPSVYAPTVVVADGDKGDITVAEAGADWRVIVRNDEAYNIRAGGDNHYEVAADSILGWFNEYGDFFLGKNLVANNESEDGGRICADFLWDARSLRLFTRNISCSMIADPCDINLRRWGPDQAGWPYGGREFIDGEWYPIDGTFEDLTGLGVGANVGQLRASPALVPYGVGNNSDTPGGRAEASGAVFTMRCADDMPRFVTDDGQVSVAMAVEVNLAPKNSHDLRNTYLRIDGATGNTRLGARACLASDTGALLQIRAHEGTNNTQMITATRPATGGTFQLKYYPLPASSDSFSTGVLTAAIAYNATPATIQAALEALSEIGTGNVTCVSSNLAAPTSPVNVDPVDVEFVGDLAGTVLFRMGDVSTALTNTNPEIDPKYTVSRVGQVGIDHELDKRLLDLQHATGHTTDYFRIRDGDNSNALTLESDKSLLVGGPITAPSMTSWTRTVADDTAFYIEFDAEAWGMLAVTSMTGNGGTALIMFRTGAATACQLLSSGIITVIANNTPVALTGTTGVDGNLTFRAVTGTDRLYLENRTGASRSYAGSFFAMGAPQPFTLATA